MKRENYFSKFVVITIATTIFLSGCATVFTGTSDIISFNSAPSGAIIYIDGVEQCITPCTMKVTRNVNDTYVEFKLDGYQTRLITLSKEFNVVSVLNLGNLLGWGIDVLSGAVFKYDRKVYDISLDGKTTTVLNPTKINIDTQKNIVELYVVKN